MVITFSMYGSDATPENYSPMSPPDHAYTPTADDDYDTEYANSYPEDDARYHDYDDRRYREYDEYTQDQRRGYVHTEYDGDSHQGSISSPPQDHYYREDSEDLPYYQQPQRVDADRDYNRSRYIEEENDQYSKPEQDHGYYLDDRGFYQKEQKSHHKKKRKGRDSASQDSYQDNKAAPDYREKHEHSADGYAYNKNSYRGSRSNIYQDDRYDDRNVSQQQGRYDDRLVQTQQDSYEDNVVPDRYASDQRMDSYQDKQDSIDQYEVGSEPYQDSRGSLRSLTYRDMEYDTRHDDSSQQRRSPDYDRGYSKDDDTYYQDSFDQELDQDGRYDDIRSNNYDQTTSNVDDQQPYDDSYEQVPRRQYDSGFGSRLKAESDELFPPQEVERRHLSYDTEMGVAPKGINERRSSARYNNFVESDRMVEHRGSRQNLIADQMVSGSRNSLSDSRTGLTTADRKDSLQPEPASGGLQRKNSTPRYAQVPEKRKSLGYVAAVEIEQQIPPATSEPEQG